MRYTAIRSLRSSSPVGKQGKWRRRDGTLHGASHPERFHCSALGKSLCPVVVLGESAMTVRVLRFELKDVWPGRSSMKFTDCSALLKGSYVLSPVGDTLKMQHLDSRRKAQNEGCLGKIDPVRGHGWQNPSRPTNLT